MIAAFCGLATLLVVVMVYLSQQETLRHRIEQLESRLNSAAGELTRQANRISCQEARLRQLETPWADTDIYEPTDDE
jgi:chromosome segregation ATPase